MSNAWDFIKYCWIDRRLQREVTKRYYRDLEFFYLDRDLLTAYTFKNPYKISKNYLKDRGERDIHVYGETPLQTYETIAKKVGITSRDVVLELGSGRGRGAFFLRHFFQCEVIGIERIPHFVKVCCYLRHVHLKKGISFICADMFEKDFPQATVIYLYGTVLSDREIHTLIEKLKRFPKGTKIVSISYPLTAYCPKGFCNEISFSVMFPWGKTDAYVQTAR